MKYLSHIFHIRISVFDTRFKNANAAKSQVKILIGYVFVFVFELKARTVKRHDRSMLKSDLGLDSQTGLVFGSQLQLRPSLVVNAPILPFDKSH